MSCGRLAVRTLHREVARQSEPVTQHGGQQAGNVVNPRVEGQREAVQNTSDPPDDEAVPADCGGSRHA